MPGRPFPIAITAAAIVLLLAGCATGTPSLDPAAGVPAPAPLAPPTAATVAEAYVSADVPGAELDSLATWTTDDGQTWLIASAKSSHRLVVFDADDGTLLRTFGQQGDAPGSFDRPNGLAVFGDLLFVVERDNRRVQVLRLPDFEPVADFGQDTLRSPYGLWLHETAPGELEAYVTDSYMDGERFDIIPPPQRLGERVRRYRIALREDGRLETQLLASFGDTAGPGMLRMVESIAGDPARRRLLIADEHRPSPSNLHEYGFDGRYAGRSLPEGTFAGEAEGVALWACRGDGGYWVAVDQQAPLTSFPLFDRDDLRLAGSFSGQITAQTDGIALHATATARFPAGALFAVHDDRAVVAFDLRDIARALRLDPDCLP
ncbi:MAG: phytase [Luteimonas sp.]